jgi:dephospho-CoA kinase
VAGSAVLLTGGLATGKTSVAKEVHVVVNDERDLEDVAGEVMRVAGWIL